MILSPSGRSLIQSFEGLSLKAYPDAAGYSIGYGHFGAKAGDVITHDEAERLFSQDVLKFETIVALTTPSATQNQFDAMVSLAYNIGTAGFSTSTVARMHNLGDYQSAADAFRLWNKSQGAVHAGLVARREKERTVYLGGVPGPVYAPAPTTTVWPIEPAAPAADNAHPDFGPPIVVGVVLSLGMLLWHLLKR